MAVQQLEDILNIVRANWLNWINTVGLRAKDVIAERGETIKSANVRPKVFIHASEETCFDFRKG